MYKFTPEQINIGAREVHHQLCIFNHEVQHPRGTKYAEVSYTTNPNMPKVRQDVAHMVYIGYLKAEVVGMFEVGPGTICYVVKERGKLLYPPYLRAPSIIQRNFRVILSEKS